MDNVIETISLKKIFGNQISVDNLNIHIKKGEVYGLLGRNGAGKTTSMRMIMGLVKPSEGQIKIFGKDYGKNVVQTYRRIGSIIETPGFYENLTAAENLEIFSRLRGTHKKDAIRTSYFR